MRLSLSNTRIFLYEWIPLFQSTFVWEHFFFSAVSHWPNWLFRAKKTPQFLFWILNSFRILFSTPLWFSAILYTEGWVPHSRILVVQNSRIEEEKVWSLSETNVTGGRRWWNFLSLIETIIELIRWCWSTPPPQQQCSSYLRLWIICVFQQTYTVCE